MSPAKSEAAPARECRSPLAEGCRLVRARSLDLVGKGHLGFLVGPLLLVIVVGVAALLKHFQPLELFGYAIGFLIVGSLLWVTISTLWPPDADRTCPACGSGGIVRLDPKTTVGLSCQDCGWKDPDQSSWLLAEDDGPLEEIVLAQKRGWTPPPSQTRRETT